MDWKDEEGNRKVNLINGTNNDIIDDSEKDETVDWMILKDVGLSCNYLKLDWRITS